MGDESIWKKEISFGRKRKDEESEPRGESESVWKKEISFGRKKKAEEPAQPEAVPESVEEPAAPSEQTWTRAVSFGRKSQTEPVPGVSSADEPVAEEPVAEDIPAVVDMPVAAVDAEEAPPPAEEQSTAPEETWTRAVSFGRKSQPEPAVEESAPVVELPVAEEATPVLGDAPAEPAVEEPAWSKEVSFSRAPAQPELQPEPVAVEAVAVPEPAPRVHAPVTAEELQRLDETEPEKKVPFWKKEIGGKKKPKAESLPAAPVAVATDDGEPEKRFPSGRRRSAARRSRRPSACRSRRRRSKRSLRRSPSSASRSSQR
jgi:hypothetical protein